MKARTEQASLYFESQTEKLDAVRELNRLLRADGKPAVHEGLSQTDKAFAIYLCIVETPVEGA